MLRFSLSLTIDKIGERLVYNYIGINDDLLITSSNYRESHEAAEYLLTVA